MSSSKKVFLGVCLLVLLLAGLMFLFRTVITPVVVRMQPPGLKKGQPWYKIPASKYHCELVVGEDIDPRAWLAGKPMPIASRRLNDHLQAYFARETLS